MTFLLIGEETTPIMKRIRNFLGTICVFTIVAPMCSTLLTAWVCSIFKLKQWTTSDQGSSLSYKACNFPLAVSSSGLALPRYPQRVLQASAEIYYLLNEANPHVKVSVPPHLLQLFFPKHVLQYSLNYYRIFYYFHCLLPTRMQAPQAQNLSCLLFPGAFQSSETTPGTVHFFF